MTRFQLTRGGMVRLAVELALVSFTLWLIVQNALLIAMHPWPETPRLLILAGTLIKVAFAVLAALWPWISASVVIAAGLAIGFTRGQGIDLMTAAPRSARARIESEVRHG